MCCCQFFIFVLLSEFLLCQGGLKVNENEPIPSLGTDAHPGLPGGISLVDLSDKERLAGITKLTRKAVAKASVSENGTEDAGYEIIRIKEASTQVVAGSATRVVFYVGQCEGNNSTLLNNSNIGTSLNNPTGEVVVRDKEGTTQATETETEKGCVAKENGQHLQCYINVLQQPWRHVFEVSESTCKSATRNEALGL